VGLGTPALTARMRNAGGGESQTCGERA
jgi:hypothetical protein